MKKLPAVMNILLLGVAIWCAGNYLVIEYWDSQADDFASLSVAVHVVAAGQVASLYDHHPSLFHVVPPGEFACTAERIGFKGFLHPYIHLPIFSLLFRFLIWIPYPVATRVFLLLNVGAVLLSLFLLLKFMNRERDLSWWWVALLTLSFFFPLRYSLWLGQTSPLVFLGVVAIFFLNKKGYPRVTGFLLGVLICFKLTPVFLLCYLILRKRWTAVITCVSTIVVLAGASVLFLGWDVHEAFFHAVTRLGKRSLASWNNQSLDGFLLRWITDSTQLYDWYLLELSCIMTAAKYGIGIIILALWLLILFTPRGSRDEQEGRAFSFALFLMVLLPPIAWSHYLLFMVFPCAIMVQQLVKKKGMPSLWFIRGVLFISWVAMALPPSYLGIVDTPSFLSFLDRCSFTRKFPLPLVSSCGFLGVIGMVVVTTYVHFCKERIQHRCEWKSG